MQPEFILLHCQLNTESSCFAVMFCFSFSSTLCESAFPFCWFFFRSMLPRKEQIAEVTTLLADGPLLEAFHKHLSASSVQHHLFSSCSCPLSLHFLSMAILSRPS